MFGARGRKAVMRRNCPRWACGVPLVAVGLILSACTDEAGVTPPDPLRAVGAASHELIIATTEDTGECDPSPGECSLRGAIEMANNDPDGGPHTIVLAPDETYTLTLGSSLVVESAIAIEGNGATIQQTDNDRVLTVTPGAELALDDVTVTGGDASGLGGGIYNDNGTLTLTNSTVTGNHSEESGGGIAAEHGPDGVGSTELINSVVSNNSAGLSGGGIRNNGGVLTIEGSRIIDNESTDEQRNGGGISNNLPGILTLTRSIVSDNRAAGRGGGIGAFGRTTLSWTTVSGNTGRGGGGIFQSDDARLTVVNGTVSGNTGSGSGTGLVAQGDVTLLNSTVTGNNGPGPALFVAGRTVALNNTIVADQQSGTDCESTGTIVSLGHNLDSDGTCELTAPGDLPNANAKLGPLADNGGPTPTHALLEGSDAIDAGDDAVCAEDPVNGVDQRGVERPQGTSCDIGAFEHEEPEPLVIVSTELPDGRVGVPYSATLEAEGGTPPYRWGTNAGGGVPDGLTLPVSGQITGTPTEAGTFEVSVVVFDNGEPGRSAEQDFLLTIEPNTHDLTVVLAGNGEGQVASDPAGIDCPGECIAEFEESAEVTLSARASESSEFSGWTGEACNGDAATITLTMSDARTCTATFDLVPVATALTAEPALLQLEGLLGLRLRLLDLTARLVRADTGAPIQGETIAMTISGQGGGSQEVCSAVTDADGVATCSGGLQSLLGLVLSGYTATFAGNEPYEPSSASAPLTRIEL